MSYVNAPATKMLATHCCVCHRPLLDAKSVELGIGPDCLKRHGFNIDVPEVDRVEANFIVWQIAADPMWTSVRSRAGSGDLTRVAA